MKLTKSALGGDTPTILAIDTSCDETSVAVMYGQRLISHVLSSQVELHKKWGGVVPMVARRAHEENLEPAIKEALKRARLTLEELDAIAATFGPGLAIDLEVGLNYAKNLAIEYGKPFIPVNHMEGHLLSSLVLNSQGKGKTAGLGEKDIFPALGMLISGKHTEIIYAEALGKYTKLGKTLDDAAGEAFDKVGRMLNFGYPGGPIVSEFAKKGRNTDLFRLPVPMQNSTDLNFSYSGLKTACLYTVQRLRDGGHQDKMWVNDFCRQFVDVVGESITNKLERALLQYPEVKSVLAGGGVYKNEQITRRIGDLARKFGKRFLLPKSEFRTDNAAMIGAVAHFSWLRREYLTRASEISSVDRVPRLEIG